MLVRGLLTFFLKVRQSRDSWVLTKGTNTRHPLLCRNYTHVSNFLCPSDLSRQWCVLGKSIHMDIRSTNQHCRSRPPFFLRRRFCLAFHVLDQLTSPLRSLQRTMESILCSRLMFVILQRQKVLHISGTGTEGVFGTGHVEEPGIPNSREVLTSFEEYPRHWVADGVESQVSGRELSRRAAIGIYDQRW